MQFSAIKALGLAVCLMAAAGVRAQSARVLTTSGDRSQSLKLSSVKAKGNDARDAIVVSDNRRQEIDGYGYAITYAAAHELMRMNPDEHRALIERTFSPEKGYGVSYVRISLGCNDFSSGEFSLCDIPSDDLRDFALSKDDIDYVIPILKEILAVNPDVKIIAAPWTPPHWMKVFEQPADFDDPWTSGHLNQQYRRLYGEYFVKFIRAMAGHGIKIHAVSPQNEPLNPGNSASLVMPWDEQADFVKEGLAPALKAAGLKTKIYLFDHNYNYDNIPSQQNYPVKAYDRMGTGFPGEELVAGAAYHSYGGSVWDITGPVVKGRPDKELIFTEASIGTWNDGRNLNRRLAHDMDELVIAPALNDFRGSLVWNFMLDTTGAPNRPKGCRTCYGAIDLDVDNPEVFTLNSHYYIMAHASDAVRPGARRLDTTGWSHDGVSYAAFANPDGSVGVLISNKTDKAVSPKVNALGHTWTLKVPARGVVSARLTE